MTRQSLLFASFAVGLFFCEKVSCFTSVPTTQKMTTRRRTDKGLPIRAMHEDDSAEYATPLKLSVEDKERFTSLQTRQMTMPILILDAMVPNQELKFETSDPKFVRLVQYCLENDSEVCMLGINPSTRSPLSRGVTFAIDEESIQILPGKKSIVLSIKAGRRMEVQSPPWLDESGSFYLAEVEMIDSRREPSLPSEQKAVATQLSDTLPNAIEEWSKWLLKTGKTDEKGLASRMESLGPMPSDLTGRAFWVSATVNPLPALGVCLEIRPAMLACTNDYERMILACQAIRSSIDHMSGKRRLF